MAQGDIWLNLTLLTNASAGENSAKCYIVNYNHTSIIATIASGNLTIKVSNDGTNFVIYDSLTSDGYVELTGYSYVQLTVASGNVESAALTSQKRYSFSDSKYPASKNMRYSRLKSGRGWEKGEI